MRGETAGGCNSPLWTVTDSGNCNTPQHMSQCHNSSNRSHLQVKQDERGDNDCMQRGRLQVTQGERGDSNCVQQGPSTNDTR